MSSISKFVLPNGVRVLVEPNHSVGSVAVGLTCNAGSRHEVANEDGITHFNEHMLFKGTGKRTAKEIAEAIEGRGGILNAFTDKEQTTYYCRVLAEDAVHAIEVLSDMLQNSLFDPEETEREKMVILEEISRGEDEPGDHVHELHISSRWGDHPLGKPVIGTRDTVKSFTPAMLRAYIQRRYLGQNVILSLAGDVDPEAILEAATKYLAGLSAGSTDDQLAPPPSKVSNTIISKDVEQVHFCIGGDSVSVHDSRRHTAAILDSILGGGMSSRLFQELREKRGLAYSVGSYNLAYSVAGLFTIYGGTSPAYWDQVQELVPAEINKLVNQGLAEGELERVKRQIAGNTTIALEGMNSRMLRMTKNELIYGKEIPITETLAKINAVTETMVRDLASDLLAPEKLSQTVIGPLSA